ncbi:MAG: alkaline phosphatase D family protein [Bacteroidota bacterium]
MTFKQYLILPMSIAITCLNTQGICQTRDTIFPRYDITLDEAHIGSLRIDTMLLNSYETMPSNVKQFYLDSRKIFEVKETDFTNPSLVETASKHGINLIAGPILGDLKSNSICIWVRTAMKDSLTIEVAETTSHKTETYILKPKIAGKSQRVVVSDLSPNTQYNYRILYKANMLAKGAFSTPPDDDSNSQVRIIFGSCSHKIGLYNSNLMNTILKRKPHAFLLLGDIAVDDRENHFGLHRSDYLLRDRSKAWQKLAANIAIYASWDDHDYLNNDLAGLPAGFTEKDRAQLRTIWRQNWNNPTSEAAGTYFNTRIGQAELIVLDTRSYRKVEERGQLDAYLGREQMNWLKNVLKNSTATFKVISSGTMWSDYVTNGKDSWGTWDTLGRAEIFEFIESEEISGTLLISGDRHGARGFKIPRKSGFAFYEFEAASLGGVPGPPAMAKDTTHQLFGYHGKGLKAFGEITFDMTARSPKATFRLINEFGAIMEEHVLPYEVLNPRQ